MHVLVTNKDVARIFSEMATYLVMQDVLFKPRAYEKAAESIASLDIELSDLYTTGGIDAIHELPTIGTALAAHIEELLTTGKLKEYEQLKKKIPVDLESLAHIEGLGPKSIKTLYDKLGIKNRDDLQRQAKKGAISKLSGFGEKIEQKLLQNIAIAKERGGRMLLGDVMILARSIEARLQKISGVHKATVAGSIRRWKETVGDIDCVVSADDSKKVMDFFVSMPEVVSVEEHGETRSIVHLRNGLDCDLRVVSPAQYGSTLLYFTGSKDHVVELRKIAIKKGLTMNEYGLSQAGTEHKNKAGLYKTEQEVYKKLGLDYIEPELREMCGELEAAKKHTLPQLVGYNDLKGDFQVQTTWTDGANTIEEMALAAKKVGLSYIAITDHTQSLTVTGGLDEKELEKHGKEIDQLNKKLTGFTLLKGAEVNILKDGSLDINNRALSKLDVVGISIHSNFAMSQDDMTARIIKAMQNPYVHILFHPTGRLINRREPYKVDIDEIIKAAKKYNVILEVNAYPDRLDLKDVYIKKAIEAGVMIAIDSDAHATSHFDYLQYGIGQARRGWATKKDVLNTRSVSEVKKILRKKK